MEFPTVQEVFCVALREAGVSKPDLCFWTLFGEIESDNLIHAGIPVGHAPGLNDAFVRNQLEMAADDAPAE